MRIVFITTLLVGVFSAVSCLFWHNDWPLRLGPSVSARYTDPAIGTYVDLAGRLPVKAGKPLMIHFFNPECLCTRFNIKRFKSLVSAYEGQMDFAIVVLSRESYTRQEIQRKFDLDVPVVFDRSVAADCRVYSTPTAVLLDHEWRICYKGNYERTTNDRNTATCYAQAAIETLLSDNTPEALNPYAQQTSLCVLPVYIK